MSAKHTIVINGKVYDTATGLPVDKLGENAGTKTVSELKTVDVAQKPAPKPHTTAGDSTAVHQTSQKSTTLHRAHLETPKSKVPVATPKPNPANRTERSPMIVHFAPRPQPLPKHEKTFISEVKPLAPTMSSGPAVARLTSRDVKEKLIANASSKIETNKISVDHKTEKKGLFKRSLQTKHVISACLALVIFGGYLTYLNMPGLSVRIAASQSGVAATYPDYSPDGYSFEGPVAYQTGEVQLHFKSNGGGEGYSISQKASNWNSVAVLDNLVTKESGGKYETTSEGGIIIYTYDNKAAWSNGGVLYTIESKAPLNNDSLIHIASSM